MRIRTTAPASLLALAALACAGASTAPPAVAEPQQEPTVIRVTDPCRLVDADGRKAESRVAALAKKGYRGVVEIRLPAGSFTCTSDPRADDAVFHDDNRFYLGNPVYTWTTSAPGVRVRIAPEGVELPSDLRERGTTCRARTRISGWNDTLQRSSYGPWLKIAPKIGADTAMPLDVRCLDVSRYVHSGITVDPQTPAGDDDGVAVSDFTFADLLLREIGTDWYRTTASGAPVRELTAGGRRTCSNGFAGIFLKQVTASRIVDSSFVDIHNHDTDGGTSVNACAPTAHGVYLRHDSSNNVLINDLFTGISGAAIDLAVRSNDNRIEDSIFNSTGYLDRHEDEDGNVTSMAAAWVLAFWERSTGVPEDAPRGNVLLRPSGDTLPAANSTESISGRVPEVSCLIPAGSGARRGYADECAASVRVVR